MNHGLNMHTVVFSTLYTGARIMRSWMAWALLISCTNCAADEWWTESTLTNTLMISTNILIIADWAQTRYIADNPRTEATAGHFEELPDGGVGFIYIPGEEAKGYKETGLAEHFIGETPTSGDVTRYFVASLILTNAIGFMLPADKKDWFYIGMSMYEGSQVNKNTEIGIEFNF